MTERQRANLRETIAQILAKIERFRDRALGEQNTKATLIEPILEALGWDIRDPDEVHREFRPTSKDNPVDYALSLLRKPRLFVEAKGLGEDMADRKWIAQVLGYATVAGVEWCVLTDGDEYRFYNATVAVDAEEKLFCRIRLSDNKGEEAASTLNLISRRNLEENLLEVLWKAHYIDRRVKQTLQEMFATADKGLIRLIRNNVSQLAPAEIVQSLRRLDFRVEIPSPLPNAPSLPPPQLTKAQPKVEKPRKTERAERGGSLAKIIKAGLLSTPLKLFRKYKGTLLEANLLPDGTIDFRGTNYQSCSLAGGEARGFVTGRPMNTNGWTFWQYLDANGKKTTLSQIRDRYAEKTKGSARKADEKDG